MDPSRRETSSPGRHLGDESSGNASPADTRRPTAQPESAASPVLRGDNMSESFLSSDTVRPRPEGYGRFHACFGEWTRVDLISL